MHQWREAVNVRSLLFRKFSCKYDVTRYCHRLRKCEQTKIRRFGNNDNVYLNLAAQVET